MQAIFSLILFFVGFPNERVQEAYINPSVDNSTETFSWAVPNFVEIRDYAQEKFGWPKQKIDEIIKPVINKFNVKISQGRIDNYFQRERITLPSKGHLQSSKRVQNAIDKVLGKTSSNAQEPKAKKAKVSKSMSEQPTSEETPTVPKAGPSNVAPKASLYRKAMEEAKKQEAKQKAIEIYQKAKEKAKPKKKTKGYKPPSRRVMDNHNLSESDSD